MHNTFVVPFPYICTSHFSQPRHDSESSLYCNGLFQYYHPWIPNFQSFSDSISPTLQSAHFPLPSLWPSQSQCNLSQTRWQVREGFPLHAPSIHQMANLCQFRYYRLPYWWHYCQARDWGTVLTLQAMRDSSLSKAMSQLGGSLTPSPLR